MDEHCLFLYSNLAIHSLRNHQASQLPQLPVVLALPRYELYKQYGDIEERASYSTWSRRRGTLGSIAQVCVQACFATSIGPGYGCRRDGHEGTGLV